MNIAFHNYEIRIVNLPAFHQNFVCILAENNAEAEIGRVPKSAAARDRYVFEVAARISGKIKFITLATIWGI